MTRHVFRHILAGAVMAGVCGLMLAGCGRKGGLELPASAMMENEKGEMVRKPRTDKPFFLDPLIR